MAVNEDLMYFYGTECHFCIEMKPLIQQLEQELGQEFNKFETWHDEDNNRKRAQIDIGLCGGVPFFYNNKTKKSLCGLTDYDKLKEWAIGE